MRLQGTVALVSGGAHRVGKAIALELARAGAHLVINYHSSEEEAQQTAKEIQTLGVEALVVRCDVTDLPSVQAMYAKVFHHFGRLQILVNSASAFEFIPFPIREEAALHDYQRWHRVVDILIDGAFYMSNTFAPLLMAQNSASIVNILDNSIVQPWPNLSAHVTGKSGLLGLTRQLALEMAPAVRVNAVAPGPVLAPEGYSSEQMHRVAQRTLLKRWGNPQDIGKAVCFLCEADYITAEVLHVDGGERYGHDTGW